MNNFEKKLEDATDEDLRRWVNEYDFRVVPLASDELTRRYLKSLQNKIKNLNKTTSHYSKQLVRLTIILTISTLILLFVAIEQVVITMAVSQLKWWVVLIAIIIFFACIFWVIEKIKKEILNNIF